MFVTWLKSGVNEKWIVDADMLMLGKSMPPVLIIKGQMTRGAPYNLGWMAGVELEETPEQDSGAN